MVIMNFNNGENISKPIHLKPIMTFHINPDLNIDTFLTNDNFNPIIDKWKKNLSDITDEEIEWCKQQIRQKMADFIREPTSQSWFNGEVIDKISILLLNDHDTLGNCQYEFKRGKNKGEICGNSNLGLNDLFESNRLVTPLCFEHSNKDTPELNEKYKTKLFKVIDRKEIEDKIYQDKINELSYSMNFKVKTRRNQEKHTQIEQKMKPLKENLKANFFFETDHDFISKGSLNCVLCTEIFKPKETICYLKNKSNECLPVHSRHIQI